MDRFPTWPFLFVAWLLLGAAVFAAFIGWTAGLLLCEQGCKGTLGTVRTLEVALPLVGLVPAVLLVVFTGRRRWHWALGALFTALAVYGLWGWMLELLTHPSDHGITPF